MQTIWEKDVLPSGRNGLNVISVFPFLNIQYTDTQTHTLIPILTRTHTHTDTNLHFQSTHFAECLITHFTHLYGFLSVKTIAYWRNMKRSVTPKENLGTSVNLPTYILLSHL